MVWVIILKVTLICMCLQGHFCDVQLACDGQVFLAHRLVLASCSEYFAKILLETPADSTVVVLNNVHYSTMDRLIKFMYIGQVQVPEDELKSLMSVATCLQVKGLMEGPDNSASSGVKHQRRQVSDHPDEGVGVKRQKLHASSCSSPPPLGTPAPPEAAVPQHLSHNSSTSSPVRFSSQIQICSSDSSSFVSNNRNATVSHNETSSVDTNNYRNSSNISTGGAGLWSSIGSKTSKFPQPKHHHKEHDSGGSSSSTITNSMTSSQHRNNKNHQHASSPHTTSTPPAASSNPILNTTTKARQQHLSHEMRAEDNSRRVQSSMEQHMRDVARSNQTQALINAITSSSHHHLINNPAAALDTRASVAAPTTMSEDGPMEQQLGVKGSRCDSPQEHFDRKQVKPEVTKQA